MGYEEPQNETTSGKYQSWVQEEIESGRAPDEETAMKIVELGLFNARIGQFSENDLKRDDDGSWDKFRQKVRRVSPEIPEGRLIRMRVAVEMHLCNFKY